MFCTTLLLFGCQDTAIPVGPELVSPVASETAGVTFAAGKPDPGSCITSNPDHHCPDSGDPGGDPVGTLSLADDMEAEPFDVVFEVKDGVLRISNNNNIITTPKPDIKLNFMEDTLDKCVGIKQTNGGTAPEPGDPDFLALLDHLDALVMDVTAVIGIDLAHVDGQEWDGHSFLFVYDDKRSIKLPKRHGTVTELSTDPAVQRVFEFIGAVVVRKGGKGIKAQRAIRCPGQRVELTFNPNP